MRTTALVQARMGSTRLPGKVLCDICGTPMIQLVLDRLKSSTKIDEVGVVTSINAENDSLCDFLENIGYRYFRGSEENVLHRYYQASKYFKAKTVVRITGDCPMIDPGILDEVISLFQEDDVDYASNIMPPTYPDGLDVEVFSVAALKRAQAQAVLPYDREHVTPFFRNGGFKIANQIHDEDLSSVRLSVDEPEDLEVARDIFAHFAPKKDFGFLDIIGFLAANPDISLKNSHIPNNEGSKMSSGQKMWRRAKKIIPGGSMLLSKQSEMHLPEHWPSYFAKTRGCKVWDLDGRVFTDTYLMGVGTNILGYSHPEVDAAVIDAVNNGNMSTLNAPEEVQLAEKLLELDPWAGMVRLARSGGEANSIAIRIARAATGRDGVAVCGYHGWHDWYLSANLGDDNNLAGHLLPGLNPKGVPKALRGMVHPFNYNDIEALNSLIKSKSIGVIKMEVVRNMEPKNNFLNEVRKLADHYGIVLIFDECTSGFRETFGGLHKKYNVEPDIAVYGKTLGNGYAISAVVGRESVMQSAQTTFISSTFWTERIGPVASLKTLEVMGREKSWEHATEIGQYVRKIWTQLSQLHGIDISFSGLYALSSFAIKSDNALAYKTLITQEMLKKGYLAANTVYTSLAHTTQIFDKYAEDMDSIFGLIRECEDGRDVFSLLEGPVCHTGFKRVN